MTEFLRTDVADQVRGPVGAAILVAVEAGDAQTRVLAPPIGREIELLLRERREEQPQAFELLRVQDAVEQLVVIVARDQLTARDVAEILTRREVNRRRELGQEPVGNVEIEVEAGEVTARLFLDPVDLKHGKHHPAFGMVRVRQRHEARGEQSLVADVVRRHRRQRVPRHAGGQLHPHAVLNRLASAHRDPGDGTVAEVVAGARQVELALHDGRLGRAHPIEHRSEVVLVDGHVARRAGRGRDGLPDRLPADAHDGSDHDESGRCRNRLP